MFKKLQELFIIIVAVLSVQLTSFTSSISNELPSDLPLPIMEIIDNPSPEAFFLSPFGPSAQQGGSYKNYLMILDSNLNVVSHKLVPGQENGYIGYHFKAEPNGLLSYLTRRLDGNIFLVDTSYNVIRTYKDTFSLYNRVRYYAHYDLLPNGNTLTVLYNFQYVDLSKYFPTGEPNGAVLQAIVQELDKDNNVVFNWKSLDHVPVNKTQNPPTPAIDYFHPNSMVLDHDGNLLLSARDICSIIKIDRQTGEIIWNLGGKDNDFTFVGENETNAPNYFSYQHDIRILPNGNVTIFDNGRQHNPQYSRAVEYELDQDNKIATMVWEYRHNPDFYADQHGSAQRMPNGNTLIAWGTYSMDGLTAVTEVRPDNSIALEFKFPTGLESQFIYKYPWPVCPLIAKVEKRELLPLNTYIFNDNSNITGVEMTFNELNAFIYNRMSVEKYDCSPLNPEFVGRPPIVYPYRIILKDYDVTSFDADLRISLDTYLHVVNKNQAKIYFREIEGSGIFSKLETTYDVNNNQLVANTSKAGEYIFGFEEFTLKPQSPLVYYPTNGSRPSSSKPLKFDWNPRGYFLSSTIQVADDTLFNNIIIDTTLRQISLMSNDLQNGKKYFWRVLSSNDAGNSDWSEINSFILSEPYIQMLIPNGGEIWDTTANIIRWDYNLKDSIDQFFKIELLREGKLVNVIHQSRFSAVNAFKWLIPSTIEDDSTYQIRVTSVSDTTIKSTSDGFFRIRSKDASVDVTYNNPNFYINPFPNPANSWTTLDFAVDDFGLTTITIVDIFGNKKESIYSEYLSPGNYKFNWSTNDYSDGFYFIKLKIGTKSTLNKLIILK